MGNQEVRLDELARQAGVATTTVRLYQNKGLLPPPRLEGRTGWYDTTHLSRLQLIGRLQADGFSLASIGKVVSAWERGRDLDDLVGVERQLDALISPDRSVVVGLSELAMKLPPEVLTPELTSRAAALGLLQVTANGQIRIPDRRFLEIGSELARLGVPGDEILNQWERLRALTDQVAASFVDLFETYLLPDGLLDELSAADLERLAATLATLARVARHSVVTALDSSLSHEGGHRMASLISAVGSAQGKETA